MTVSEPTAVAEVLAAIENGPSGPEIGAFFDLDGTLVQGYTAGTFASDRLRRGEVGPGEFARVLLAAVDGTVLGGNPQSVGEVGFASLRGHSEDELNEIAERLFHQKIASTIRSEARAIVRAHLRKGHTVVVASAATRPQIEPVARDLGIGHLLCTELEVEDGILTGRAVEGMLWGDRKAKAVRAFGKEHGIDLPASTAYANGHEDIAFLSSVGHPHALNPHPLLRAAAEQYGWPVVMLQEPRSAGLRSIVRTGAALAGMNVGLAAGVAYGVVTRDRRAGINKGIELATKSALSLGGVKLNVVGRENVEKGRPAVFIGNHQSSLDPVVVGALLEHDVTGVAKKEAKYDPRILMMTLFMDPAFIDRGNVNSAKATLDGVVDKLRGGTSVMIFPEGTRLPTPVLGRFKKGAFHIAMQAGVPIVPIVIRNAGELMWRGATFMNEGTVDVAVLEPIPTHDWTLDDLEKRIAEVRQLYVDTLDDWPEGDA